MYNIEFANNTTTSVGKLSAKLWIQRMQRDSGYWDWMYDYLLQASNDYKIVIKESLIIFCDKD